MPASPGDPAAATGSDSSETAGSGPVLQLLASGLQLWLRQQCEGIESLEIRLEGSALSLLRGRLAGVQVMARRATYAGLEIEQVNLRSEPIQVQMGQVLRGKGLQLDHPFQIHGQVSFTGDGLSRSLARPRWQGLGDALGEALLGIAPLTELRVQASRLVISARGGCPAGCHRTGNRTEGSRRQRRNSQCRWLRQPAVADGRQHLHPPGRH